MRKGNTFDARKLPDIEEMSVQLPVKIDPAKANVAYHFAASAVVSVGSVWLFSESVSSYVPLLGRVGFVAGPVVATVFIWRFVMHTVVTRMTHPPAEEREQAHDTVAWRLLGSLAVAPLSLVFACFTSLYHCDNLCAAWRSYVGYDCRPVANPGVVRRPGGSRPTRLLLFHLSVFLLTWGLVSIPVFGAPSNITWWAFWPVLLAVPAFVILAAPMFLSLHLDTVKEWI